MISLSVATSLFAIVFRVIGFPGILDCYNFWPSAHLCIHSSACSQDCATVAHISIGILFGPATIIPVILYVPLYMKGWKARKNQAAMVSASGVAGLERQKREWKATITFCLLLLAVFALTSPIVILALIATTISRTRGPSPVLYVVSAIASTLTTSLVVIDPIVILRHGNVRRILTEIKDKVVQSWSTSQSQDSYVI